MPSRDPIQYAPDAGLLMIPGDPAKDFAPAFAVFDDSVPALRAFVLGRLRKENVRPVPPKAKCDAVIPVRVALVPRPDNDYDTRAVSVAAPPHHGGSVLDRHMGYLHSSALHITSESIRELTEETGTPVGCHGWIELYDLEADGRFHDEDDEDDEEDGEDEDEDEGGWEPSRHELVSWTEQKAFGYAVGSVRVLLPERQTVRALVDSYLAARRQEADQRTEKEPAPTGVEQGRRRALAERLAIQLRTGLSRRATGGTWGRETERDRARQRRDAEARPLLRAWETYRSAPHGFRDLRAVTRSVFHHTRILVLDGSGVEVGQYHQPDGPLTLVDSGYAPRNSTRCARKVMLCRFLVPRPGSALLSARPSRPARTWTEWLGHAGLLTDGVRTSMGTATTATDGHPCRSLFERHVDDFLHHRGVAHEPEPAYPRHPELNTTGLRADWRLADGTFVEALGLMTKEAYAAKVARKRELARHHGLRLVTVTAEDLGRLPEVFADWLPEEPARQRCEAKEDASWCTDRAPACTC